ncbi:MAG: fucose isomerase [Eubacteriales bacterium]|nr:fucose isomerase [Eubacteriales bacterium]
MLKQIPGCISPDLMRIMMQMGHGDELVVADADFPADTFGKRVVRADGVRSADLVDAILQFYPLDPFSKRPAAVMAPVGEAAEAPALSEIKTIIKKYEPTFTEYEYVERFAYYERAKQAFAVVITSEPDGNVILKKGVVNL